MHYFKRNIGDYHKKAGRLSMLEHGAYTLLLDACYDRERFPTEDEAIDWCWARTEEEMAAVRFVLRKFFTLDGDRYMQTRIAEEIKSYHEKSSKNKQIALEREKNRRTNRARFVHEAPPNQEPLTINQLTDTDVSVVASEGLAACPHKEILAVYAEVLPELPQPRVWEGNRRDNLASRWRWVVSDLKKRGKPHEKDDAIGFFRRMFAYVSESDFLMGRVGNRPWSASLPWMVKAENFAKIIEGEYENKDEL